MPNADSKNKNIRHIRQIMPVKMLKVLSIINNTNMAAASAMPIIQANFFCGAPTGAPDFAQLTGQ